MTRLFPLIALLASLAACGNGLYDDSGQPSPGQWWPWVCADIPTDGGAPGLAPDSGCAPACDGGVDGGC
ncbi:MAG: hypothetical protein ACYDCL_20490 [Myxococcales bacterium]